MLTDSPPGGEFRTPIERFWAADATGRPGERAYEIFPDCNVDLLFVFSGSACKAFIYGPATRASHIHLSGVKDYFGVRFRPGMASRLADVRATEAVDNSLELHRLCGADVAALGERLRACRTAAAKGVIVEGTLRAAGVGSGPPDALVDCAVRLVRARSGQVTVREVAEYFLVSTRTLDRVFLEHVGVQPKTFIRITRLRRARAMLVSGDRPRSLAEVAARCGYYDQSHLIKDFRALVNRLPSSF
jgi:AraC-like DNA-binding protein